MAYAAKKITLATARDFPFEKLSLSQANVRRIKAGISVEELAESIARRGLIQSLMSTSLYRNLADRPLRARHVDLTAYGLPFPSDQAGRVSYAGTKPTLRKTKFGLRHAQSYRYTELPTL